MAYTTEAYAFDGFVTFKTNDPGIIDWLIKGYADYAKDVLKYAATKEDFIEVQKAAENLAELAGYTGEEKTEDAEDGDDPSM